MRFPPFADEYADENCSQLVDGSRRIHRWLCNCQSSNTQNHLRRGLYVIEHYVGIILASMPALKPLFSKILNITVSSHSGSSRSFQKIKPTTASLFVPQSQNASGRSSIRGNKIRKTTEWRVSSQLEFEVNRDYELAENGAVPDFLRPAGDSWTHVPGAEEGYDSAMRTGGYTHIDDAKDTASLPGPRSNVPRG
ncbi:MAG: hypothetical protein Q9216_004473 [Gyalolechia sp. 2 TL-2023]